MHAETSPLAIAAAAPNSDAGYWYDEAAANAAVAFIKKNVPDRPGMVWCDDGGRRWAALRL